MSYSGVRVRALRHARIGERVLVSLRLPGTRLWVDAEGEVTRRSAGRRLGDGGPSLGITLCKMHGLDRIVMASYAKQQPRVRGRRGARRDYARQIARIAAS